MAIRHNGLTEYIYEEKRVLHQGPMKKKKQNGAEGVE